MNPGCPGGLVGKLMPISALPRVMLYAMSNDKTVRVELLMIVYSSLLSLI